MSIRLDFATLDLMDALDLASLIELEAHHRYLLFAAQLGSHGGYDAGAFFATMAENEAKHGRELAVRRTARFGDTPARVTMDDLFDVEAPDVGAPRSGMSTMQAFEVALAAEQKAHDFFHMALPSITDAEVSALFTELRDEETEHSDMLRVAMAKLPASAHEIVEFDSDDLPYL